MQIEEHVPLAPLTTFHIGGSTRFFARVAALDELREALAFAKEKRLLFFILGGGANLLVSDDGFAGLVIKIELKGIEFEEDVLIASAGESWEAVVKRAAQEELWGIENLSGIPGTLGGAVVQNIGAYGSALSQTLSWVEVFNIKSGEVQRLSNAECQFEYRESVFKKHPNLYVVLRAAFALSKMPRPNVSYRDLAERFAQKTPDIAELRDAVLAIRKAKFPDLTVEGTAGSFFRNPIVDRAAGEKLQQHFPAMPLFTMPETDGVKVPLAYLLDKGLHLKGFSCGGARLFERQPLVIAASRGTKAKEVRALAQQVAQKINDAYGITIEPEVIVL